MGNRDCARFLRVVLEVTLGKVFCFLTDDLDRVFIRTDGAVCTQAVEHRLDNILAKDLKTWVPIKIGMGDIVVDTNCEVLFGFILAHLIENAFDHCWSEFFR